jgi:pimeloyl-ACP methyl ester carboxylesterase
VRRALFLAAALLAAGCGGASPSDAVKEHGPLGSGPDAVWYWPAAGKPKSVVVFLHGYSGEPREETPVNHVPWLKHLARQGNDVIYPRYERGGGPNPFPHLDAGVGAALAKLGKPKVPTVVIGYSRGARIAVDYAAFRAAAHHEPRAVLAVFPAIHAPFEVLGPIQDLDSKTKIVMMIGDRDTGVAGSGAHELLYRLAQVGFPPKEIKIVGVKSTNGFVANHVSPMSASAQAQKAFWLPADRLIESVR